MKRLALAAALLALAWSAAARPAGAMALEDELTCLALNVYWEARSGSFDDRIGVAYVTLNRVQSPDFPDSICAVVGQGGEERHRCQFSWWCDGKPDAPTNQQAWQEALRVARIAQAQIHPDPTRGALFFHNAAVSPDWAAKRQRTARIGQHLYYR